MWVQPVDTDAMYETDSQLSYTDSTHDYSENRTAGGAVAYLLSVPALVAVLAAPAVVFGAVLGVVGLTLGRRVVRRLRGRRGGGLSPPDPSGRPAGGVAE
jgi:hypothetical protein